VSENPRLTKMATGEIATHKNSDDKIHDRQYIDPKTATSKSRLAKHRPRHTETATYENSGRQKQRWQKPRRTKVAITINRVSQKQRQTITATHKNTLKTRQTKYRDRQELRPTKTATVENSSYWWNLCYLFIGTFLLASMSGITSRK